MTATKVGNNKVIFVQANGKVAERIVNLAKYCPNEKTRLISIMSEMPMEAEMLSSDEQDNIILTYPNGDEIIFDCCTKSSSGWVPSVDVVSNADEIAKLGFEIGIEHLEDCVNIKQDSESLKSGDS